ncbi:c-type cytochrome [Candidatus Nitrospira bockiana]
MTRLHIGIVILTVVCAWSIPWTEARGEDKSGSGDIAKGQRLYVRHCAGCHGPEGRGDGYKLLGPSPADLTSPSTKKKSNADLLKTIHEGKPNMPAWKPLMTEAEIEDVLTYIRSLTR